MGKQAASLVPALKLTELFEYHQDIEHSLRLYFSPLDPSFAVRLHGDSLATVQELLQMRLDESDTRSTFAVLTSIEAHFMVDFEIRCQRSKPLDPLSRYFQVIQRNSSRVSLEDIFNGWLEYESISPLIVSEIRGAFKYRHWLAHGRHWVPKTSRRFDFQYVYTLAQGIVANLSFAQD